MTDREKIGGNNPPEPIDPIEAVIAEYDSLLTEAPNWTDGALVENQSQMEAVDRLIKQARSYKTAVGKAGKERTAPLHAAWKKEVAAVKVYTDDAERILRSLVASVAKFKEALAEKKRAEERAKWEAANKARLEAEEAAKQANAADLDAQRELDAKRKAAINAEKAAQVAKRDTVKGMRTVRNAEIEDLNAAAKWIWKNDRAALSTFVDKYVEKNIRTAVVDGVKYTEKKEAY